VSRLLFAAYFLEAGFILIVAPWSGFWERNRFAEIHRSIEMLLSSPFVRGAVSGIGVITVLAGLAELGGVMLARKPSPDADPQPEAATPPQAEP
jgi:hypothetical protein